MRRHAEIAHATARNVQGTMRVALDAAREALQAAEALRMHGSERDAVLAAARAQYAAAEAATQAVERLLDATIATREVTERSEISRLDVPILA